MNQMPLGTAALAGTTIPIDRQMVADELGFEGLVANSLDSSSDRDFAIEYCSVLAQISLHLSGWAEEWILWCTNRVWLYQTARCILHRFVHHASEEKS